MNQKIIDDYLSEVKSATELASASKRFKLLNDARAKLYEHSELSSEKKAAQLQSGNTFFETLKCVGYYPQERRLEAVLTLNRQYGYGGTLPGNFNGSMQYVSFYVDWNGDGNFDDFSEAVCSSYVQVYDPGSQNKPPICYAVYRDIIPPLHQPVGSVITVRAILSWNRKPTGPNFKPYWGNVVECQVRHQPVQ